MLALAEAWLQHSKVSLVFYSYLNNFIRCMEYLSVSLREFVRRYDWVRQTIRFECPIGEKLYQCIKYPALTPEQITLRGTARTSGNDV